MQARAPWSPEEQLFPPLLPERKAAPLAPACPQHTEAAASPCNTCGTWAPREIHPTDTETHKSKHKKPDPRTDTGVCTDVLTDP